MKKILIILVLALIGVAASGQTVYSCDYKSDAQVKVYVTKYKSDADLVVYKTNYKSDADANKGPTCDYLYEPSEDKLLGTILPTYIKVQAYRGMLDTSASENAARMTAMDNATRNCNDLIKSLTLLYNKTRQASITSELIDIVGGAEALNG